MICLYPHLESTSSVALQMLESGKKPPFVIQSLSQTSGRGQVGRSWQSPPGHLYISFALPLYHSDPEKMGLLPIAFGCWIADWIEQRFGVGVNLKWPNDILFGGRKLGGILCEGSVSGKTLSHVVVGVGLNLSQTTELTTDALDPVGLSEILGESLEPVSLGQELAREVSLRWRSGWREGVIQEFCLRSYPVHTPVYYQGQRRSFRGIGAGGELLLHESELGAQVVVSGREKIQWGPTMNDFFYGVFDVGNSALKLALFHGRNDHPEFEGSADWNEAEGLLDMAAKRLAPGTAIYVGSVNPIKDEMLSCWALSGGYQLIKIPKRTVRLKTSYPLSQLGLDRLASMETGILTCPRESFLIASFGTAITLDVVEEGGVHRGGFILAGLHSQLESLDKNGALLPKLHPKGMVDRGTSLGTDTESAILSGLAFSLLATINCLMKEYQIPEANLLVSGGHSSLLPLKSGKAVPSAVIKGLREIVLSGSIKVIPK